MDTSHTDSAPLWHTLPVEAVYSHLESSAGGLTGCEAERRLGVYGPNELQAVQRITPWHLLLEQFKNVLIIILLIATALSAYLGHGIEAVAIAIIVSFAVLLGFVQEYRAERAIEALRRMAAPLATVLRDGEEIDVPAARVVPGDMVLLHAGDKVPADIRLTEVFNLRIEESALTGESVAVEKLASPLDNLPLAERRNMAHAGTTASYGRGRGVVIGTGASTEFGRIAAMLQGVETGRTPLQENLDRMGRSLAKIAIIVVAGIVGLGVLRGQPFIEMFIFGIALAVAVVPEALPAVVTISLAVGVQRMVKRHALIRRLQAVETLGSTSIICSDKTGTLTKDEMTVRKIFAAGDMAEITGAGYEPVGRFLIAGRDLPPAGPLLLLLRTAVLASDAQVVFDKAESRFRGKGDPTEVALVVAAAKAGLQKTELDRQFPRIDEIPFTSEAKRMTTLHGPAAALLACAKGAPEIIIGSCTKVLTENGEEEFTGGAREKALKAARCMAGEAMRVLAVACKPDATHENAGQEMIFLGLVGMIDPPRPEARLAIETCAEAGIRVVMITGDHPLTAGAVASELGLLKDGRLVTGMELDEMTEEELEAEVEHIEVYARVSPVHKLRIVNALQKIGHIVAMTGDGVNDAPALKKADIGVAMGITGTDVTKEVSSMTLIDDNFASIVAAVEEGRGIFDNIKKYLMYLLSSNIGEIGLMAGATLLGLPLPLTAVQILYVNLATDGLPALALSVDPPDPDLMRRRPRDPRDGIFTRPIMVLMVVGGLWSTFVNLGLFIWADNSGRSHDEAMTMTFVSLVLIQFFKAYNFRSEYHSVLNRTFANFWLNTAILWELVLLAVIVYVPFLHKPFGTFSLTASDMAIIVSLAFSVSPVLELVKWLERRGWFCPKSYPGSKRQSNIF
jgi:P-type Ca2+ transporter type 2C